MRLNSVLMLCLAATATMACGSDEITNVERPPLAQVRLINGLTEGSAVDIRAIDQVEWSPVANNLAYRNATTHYPTEAGDRHIRVFPTSTDAAITSVPMLDVVMNFAPNTRVTLLLTGSTAANTVRFVVINDDLTPPAGGQIAVRTVNASNAAIDAYVVNTTTDPVAGTPTGANVGPQATSAYSGRAAGAAAVRVTPAGSTAVSASAAGPTAPATPAGTPSLPAAGVNTAGTKFSVYYFPAVTAIAASQGRPAVAATAASALWLVDRNPAD